MLTERRRSLFAPGLLMRVGIVWLALSAFLITVKWGAITGMQFSGPDDALRLVQVRDLLAGQSWFDLTQYRADAINGGVPMHWSRLVDLPLAAIIFALTPLIGGAHAETAALIIVPLVTLAFVMLFAARIAWRLLGEGETFTTCLVLAVSMPLLFQLSPMRIDHHGWQIVCALAAINGMMARNACMGGWATGGALAIWLSISIEGLPLAAVICGVMALRWLCNRNDRIWLLATMQSLALLSFALFLSTRGIGDLAVYCDAIGLVHLGMFGWGALALTVLARAEPMPLPALLLGFGVVGGGAIAILLGTAPQCAGGGFATLDPVVDKLWHDRIREGQPLWSLSFSPALHLIVTPIIGIFAALNLVSRSHEWLRRFWTEYTLVLIAATAIALLVSRAGAAAITLAAVPLAWQAGQWLRAIRVMQQVPKRVMALVGVMMALLPTIPIMLLGLAIPARATLLGGSLPPSPPPASKCEIAAAAEQLRALPAGEVFSPLDIAPRLLLETEHTIVGSGHHRGDAGIRFVIETWMASPDEAREKLISRGSAYVAVCADRREPMFYADNAPDGLIARVRDGAAPQWLEPVKLETKGSLQVWRIKRD